MPESNSVRKLGAVALIVLFGGAIAAWTQVPDGEPDVGALRERRMVLRLQQARQLLAPSDPATQPDVAQGVRLLQTILDDGGNDQTEPSTEDVFLDPPEVATNLADAKAARTARSLKSVARRLLGDLSTEGRQVYDALVGHVARAQWQAAQSNSDQRGMEHVARRWFHTSAGYAAAHALALRDLDHGDPFAAARRLEELRDCPAARAAREPELSLQLAIAWRLAGQPEHCRDVLMDWRKTHGAQAVARRDGGELIPLFTRDDALTWLDRWVGQALQPRLAAVESRDEWPMIAGNAARHALASPAVPSERAVWSHVLLDGPAARGAADAAVPDAVLDGDASPTVARGAWSRARDLVRAAREQAQQAEQARLPAAQPLVVGDAVVVRLLGQLRAFQLSTGEPLWHSAPVDTTLLRLLAETAPRRAGQTAQPDWETWLWHRAWDDESSGTLSSDGELIFALHERGVSGFFERAWPRMAGAFPQEFNALMAVEARTGRLRWEIGGSRGDLELWNSGAFFLGPPLPWRGQLFVLTDDGADIRLVVLDARDGRLAWTQTLGPSDPMWSQVRHDAGLSPSLAGECVICPTGSGKVVAVDPVRRELRWQCVYREQSDRPPTRRFDFQFPNTTLAAAWRQSVTPAVRDRVFVAPSDHNELLCLDARDGRVLWRQPRGDGLFLAGVAEWSNGGKAESGKRKVETSDAGVLIVGSSEVRAVRVSDGSAAWSQPAVIAPPCGRGVLLNGVLHLPISPGDVVSLEAATGRVLARTTVKNTDSLGNLLAVRGRLLTQSASHVAAFPALSDLQQELTRRLDKDADNSAVLEQRGRMNLHLGRRSSGLDDLRRAVALHPTAENKQSLAALLLEDLRWDGTDLESTIRELESLVDDPQQRLTFARLRAQGLQKQGQSLAAAREYLKLADNWEPASELESFASHVSARSDRYIAARLAELRELLTNEDRQRFDAEVQSRLRAAVEATGPSPLRNFVTLFGWSPAAGSARRTLVERLDAKKHRIELEALLGTLHRDANLELRAFATARLAEQWLRNEQVEMSRPLLDELATAFGNTRCLEQQTGRELSDRWRGEFRERLQLTWPATPLRVEPVSAREPVNKTFHIDWAAPPDAAHENWQLELDASTRKLVAKDSLGRVQWASKLPFEDATGPHVVGNSAMWRGRWLLLILGERFLVLDTIPPAGSADLSPRLLWQNVLFDRRAEASITPVPHQQATLIEGTPTSFEMSDSSGRRLGRAAIITEDVLVYQTGQRLIAAELSSGETLWTHDGLTAGCELSGDDQVILVTPPDRRETLVLSVLDGRLLTRREHGAAAPLTHLGRNLLLASAGRCVLSWSARADLCELRLTDALTNQDVLKERFAGNSLPCLSLKDVVAVLEPTGRLTLWSLTDGHCLLEQKLPAMPHVTHFVVLRERERWLLLTHVEEPLALDNQDKPLPRPRVTLLYFDQWRVHGPCFAFDRVTSKPLWSATLNWQGLSAHQPADSPVLLLAAKVQRPTGAEFRASDGAMFRVVALDKRNGQLRPLAEDLLAHPMNFCEQRPDIAARAVDVQIERTVQRLSFEADPPKAE